MFQVETIKVKSAKLLKNREGVYGTLFEAIIADDKSVALKIQADISPQEKEILVDLKGKQFDYIIQVIAYEQKEDGFYTIMELGRNFELKDLPDKRKACLQMAKGVSQFHKLGYFHRDIKPNNFVIGKDNNIKLIDFGTKEAQTTGRGTYVYMAPEVYIDSQYQYFEYDCSVDIWSLGMVFYEVFTSSQFFLNQEDYFKCYLWSQEQINKKISMEKKLFLWQKELLQKMIVQILKQNKEIDKSKKRIGIDEVIHYLEQQNDLEPTSCEMKEDLYEILITLREIDVQSLIENIEVMRKQKISDILEFLSKAKNQKQLGDVQNHLNKIINVVRNIKQHEFNKNNYSTEIYDQKRLELMNKIKKEENIVQFLKFLVHLTSIDNQFIQCGSNSLNLLVQMKVDLTNKNFEDIRIKNTSLKGGNLVKCNFSRSQFENVDISGMNLNGAVLLNCKWQNIKIQELNKLDGHTSLVNTVCFSPDGSTLVSGSDDKSIRLWDVKTGQQKAKLDGHSSCINSVCFSPDGTSLASGSDGMKIRLWDAKTGQQRVKKQFFNLIKTKAKLDGHTQAVSSVCFSPDGTTLASGSYDNSIRLWDVKTGQQKAKLDGHSSRIQSVCFSPDETTLASGSDDKSIRLWDVKTGQQKAKLDGHSSRVQSVCFSPDGTTLASGSYYEIRLWDVKTGQQKSKLDGHSSYVQSVCFSPDGTTLASGSDDNLIRLWDVKTGQQKAKLDGHTKAVSSVCFSPDGTTLASGSDDKSIRLWDVKTGQQKAKLDGHSSWIQSVCFSPDETTLASDIYDNSIRLWDIKTGQQKAKLDGHTEAVSSVCFSPDGTTLASGSGDNSIRLWDIKTGQQIQPSDKKYKDLLAQFKVPLISNDLFAESTSNLNILLISQSAIFQAKGALILYGEFVNHQGYDLKQLLKSKGSIFLESKLDQFQKKN